MERTPSIISSTEFEESGKIFTIFFIGKRKIVIAHKFYSLFSCMMMYIFSFSFADFIR